LARLGAAEGGDVAARLAQTPWWRGGRLARIEPYPPAAAFLEASLFPPTFPHGRKALPEWLFICLRELGLGEIGQRLSRVLYDCAMLHPAEPADALPLAGALDRMLERAPERALVLKALAYQMATPWVAPLATRIVQVLLGRTPRPESRAELLSNLSVYLSMLGRREEALAASQEAVDIYRRLAEMQPHAFLNNLAMSLSNLGRDLLGLGDREGALAASQEAVDIYRPLALARPDTCLSGLAMSLNNLDQALVALGRREEALAGEHAGQQGGERRPSNP
jgi:tetratricopeptide (TPR) repeat protein